MILGAGVLSLNDAVSKYLVESYPIGQILGLRQFAALLCHVAAHEAHLVEHEPPSTERDGGE